MNKNHLDIIKSYASSLAHQLSIEGLHYERDDLEGEFGVVYANVLEKFNPDLGTSKFETYLIAALVNRFSDIRKKLIHDVRGHAAWLNKQCNEVSDVYEDIDTSSIVNDVVSNFPLIEKKIFVEITNPSESVRSRLSDQLIEGRRGASKLHAAIALELGLNFNEVEYRVKKMRRKIRTALKSNK